MRRWLAVLVAFVLAGSVVEGQQWSFTNVSDATLYDLPLVTDITRNTAAEIRTITPHSPSAGNSLVYVWGAGAAPLGASVNDQITITGTGTGYDGNTYRLSAVLQNGPDSPLYTFTTSVTDSYGIPTSSVPDYYYDVPALARVPNGIVLAFYRKAPGHGCSNSQSNWPNATPPPGVLLLKKSTAGDSSWTTPFTLFSEPTQTLDYRNPQAGVSPKGTIILSWEKCSLAFPTAFGGVWYSRSTDNGNTWATPAQVTATDSSGTSFLFPGTGSIFTMPDSSGTLQLGIGLSNQLGPLRHSLVFSCDDGVTWGTGTGCPAGFSPVRLVGSFPTNESAFLWIGGLNIIGFIRNSINNNSTNNTMYFLSSSDGGNTWTSTQTNLPGHFGSSSWEQVSPFLFNPEFEAPGNPVTLFYADRDSGDNTVALKSLTFNPADAIANPIGFAAPQTLNTRSFVSYGYPVAVATSTNSIGQAAKVLVLFFTKFYTASNEPERIASLTAQYTVSGTKVDFTVSASPLTPASVVPRQSATSTITLTSLNSFHSAVNLDCRVAPPGLGCSINPTSMTPSANGSATAVLTITTKASSMVNLLYAPSLSLPASRTRSLLPFFALWLPLPGLGVVGFGLAFHRLPTKWLIGSLLGCFLFASLIMMTPCHDGSSRSRNQILGTLPGSYTVTVTGTSGATTRTAILTLIVQ